MKVSLNAIKKYVKVDLPTDELVKLIGARLVEVEGTDDWEKKYQGIYVVKVVECEAIPDTHLHLCKIDAGKDELIQVVCGAPNVHADMLAAWIAPGAIVPSTYGTDDEFIISERKLRGYMSSGMLAAADELGLGDDHEGIIELDPAEAHPGDTLAEVLDLNDVILDIENKSLTHRPDTFGLIGFAREVAGILGQKFTEPEWLSYTDVEKITSIAKNATVSDQIEPPIVNIADPVLCPRYTCIVLDLPKTQKSPYFTKNDAFLAKAGMRGISPIVDATNIMMLISGQPLHAFDYDKFAQVGGAERPKILVRAAREGEKLELLDGKTISCTPDDILITSNDIPVALAGAMGGKSTEIDDSTQKIILESATFSLYNLRKTQMAHGIFSEAITRFTKGQPAGLTSPVAAQTLTLLDSPIIRGISDCYPSQRENPEITLNVKEINGLLGTKYDQNLIIKTLKNVSFAVSENNGVLSVTAPYWRTDIHIKEDVIEEVGRLLGFDNIPLDFPLRPFNSAHQDDLLKLKLRIEHILSDQLNAYEVLTYSFASRRLQELTGENPEDSYEIVNSISPELQCFRQSIAPSLLEKTSMNLKAGFSDFSLYEINQTTSKSLGLNQENVPNMANHLCFATVGDFYQAKAYLMALLKELGIKPEFRQNYLENGQPRDTFAPYFEPLHSTVVSDFGTLGEIRHRVLKSLKIDQTVSVFDLNLDKLLPLLPKTSQKDLKISRFPSVSRDLTLKVANKTPYEAISSAVEAVLASEGLINQLMPISVYQAPQNASESKNLSLRLTFSHPDKTLSSSEISDIMSKVISQVTNDFAAEVV